MKAEDFLSYEERLQIAECIRIAELNTSGEIRVHIGSTTHLSAEQDAVAIFHLLDMQYTAKSNAVLLYIALDTHKVVVLGDKGIHSLVGDTYWKDIIDNATSFFARQQFLLGIILTVKSIGETLSLYFPEIANDKNELSNEVSFS